MDKKDVDKKDVAKEYVEEYLRWIQFISSTMDIVSAMSDKQLKIEIDYHLSVRARSGTYLILLNEARKRNEKKANRIAIPRILIDRAKDDQDIMKSRSDIFHTMYGLSIS